MKVQHILEARRHGDVKLYYFEYYPHYRGTLFRHFETSLNEVDQVASEVQLDDGITWWDLRDKFNHAYAFSDVLHNWSEIRQKLESKGHWVDLWEEGSHSISTKSMQHAADVVKEFEKENTDAYDDDFGFGPSYEEAMAEFPF